MRPRKGVESAKGVFGGFEREEILGRGRRFVLDRLFRGPRYRLPNIDYDQTRGTINALFPDLPINKFVEAMRLGAMPFRAKLLTLVNQIYDGDLRFLKDSGLNFENGRVTWNRLPGFEPWPKVPSWNIPFRGTSHLYGDVKRIWNLNKHSHWVLLAGCRVWGEKPGCLEIGRAHV